MPFNPDLVDEMNVLMRYNSDVGQSGIKVHSNAEPAVICATQRLHEKGLITLRDGGYLTPLGREAVEHARVALGILS